MSGSSSSASGSKEKEPSQRRPAVLFPGWPSIKIITPPKGRFSPATDERCITYCSQSVHGRISNQPPWCRSLCIRKVFSHEVRNIISYQRHLKVDSDGKAKYKLPPEGRDLPTYLGGKPKTENSTEDEEANYWHDGWYVWFSKNPYASIEKLQTMKYGIHVNSRREVFATSIEKRWTEYQTSLKAEKTSKLPATTSETASIPLAPSQKFLVPPHSPLPDTTTGTLLVPLSTSFPLWNTLDQVLAPTRRSLDIFSETVRSGDLKAFTLRVYAKAFTKEPWILADRTLKWTQEQIRGRSSGGTDNEKGSS